MAKTQTLRGFATISLFAADPAAAKKWYTELLGIDPYFESPDAEHPGYVEFRVGDYQHELGIIDSKYAPEGAAAGPGAPLRIGTLTMWQQCLKS